MISPIREEYLSRMKMAVTGFTFDVKEIVKNRNPVFVSEDEYSMKALFLINKDELPTKAQ
jgi:hypothetical protein